MQRDHPPDVVYSRSPSTSPVIRSSRTAGLLMAVYVVVVGVIVFWPTADMASGSVEGIWAVLHRLGSPGWFSPRVVEFVTNVLLFTPLSFLGHTFRPRWGWRSWLLAGLAGSVFIELTQALFLSARSPQPEDLVSNTLGAVLGYLVVRMVQSRTARS